MLSEYEASILTRFRQKNRALEAQSLRPKPAAIGLGVILVAIGLFAANAWPQAAESDRSRVSNLQRGITADGAVDAVTSRIDRRKSEGQANVEFFFGFLEFDWDPNKPGGVPGFGSWPPEVPQVDPVTAGE